MRVFAFSDTHLPFHNNNKLEKIYENIKKHKPSIIIHLGDLFDQHVFYKGRRSSESLTPEEEIRQARKLGEEMWKIISKISPKSKKYQLLGNHCLRLMKRVQERLPEAEFIIKEKYAELYSFNGVKTMYSDRDYLTFDGINYCHGWLSKSIDHARYFGAPCVHGHDHRPGLVTDGRLWSLSTGHLANEKALPLCYTPTKFSKWREACAVIENGNPILNLI